MDGLQEKHTKEYGELATKQENELKEQLNKQYLEIKGVGTQTPEMAERFNKQNLALTSLHKYEIKQLQNKQAKEKGKGDYEHDLV